MADEFGQNEAPAGGASPAPAGPVAAPTQTVTPPVSASPSLPAAAPAEDRSNWFPPYRAREMREAAAREAATKYEAQISGVRGELDRYRQQIAALTGVSQPTNTEADTIKKQFFELFPWAKKMEERFGDVEGLLDRSQDLDTQINHYWTSYGNQTMDRLFKLAGDSLGGPLTDEGKRQLHSSFVGFLQSSPELQNRYANDPSIVEDFWKQFTSSFIEPTRRAASAGIAQRAAGNTRLPQDSPSGAPQLGQAPKLNGLDERAAMAWADFQARTGRT